MIDSTNALVNQIAKVPTDVLEKGIDWKYVSILAGIMLFTGVLGGLANSLNAKKEDRDYVRSILLGIVATLTIPLFLKIVDSQIIADSGNLNNYNILVFTGFCVLAAFYAINFLEGLSSRILQDLEKKVDQTDQKLTATDEKLQETAQKTDLVLDAQIYSSPKIEDGEKSVRKGGYRALVEGEQNPHLVVEAAFDKNLETLDSLVDKTGLKPEEVQQVLTDLIQKGIIQKSTHRGKEVFGRV